MSLLEHISNTYDSEMQMLEAKGMLGSTSHYTAMNDVQRKNIEILNKEYADLSKSFNDAMNSGEIEEFSEAWYSMKNEINSVKEAIDDATLSILENEKAIRELQWSYFDYIQDQTSKLSEEADFLIELLSNSELYDEKGKLKNTGLAVMGLHSQNYNTYMSQADSYAKEILRIDKDIANDPYNTDLVERRQELLKLQQDSISAAEKEKEAIVSLVKDGIQSELDSLKELIDKRNEALNSAKDLYEFNKKVKEQTAEIANIQKQLSAYAGDTSEENRSRVQKLQSDLEKSQTSLQETERDRYISESSKMLDELYTEYEKLINERLDDVDTLISDAIDTVNTNSSTINATLKEESAKVGYTMTDSLNGIWGSDGVAGSIVSKYGEDFGSKLTTVNNVLGNISSNVAKLVGESDAQANNTIGSTSNNATTTSPSSTPATATPESNGTSSLSFDNVKRGVATAIWIYGGEKSGWSDGTERENRLKAKFGAENAEEIIKYLNENANNGMLYNYWASTGKSNLSKYYYSAFKRGGLADYTGLAWMDGTKTNPEVVLDAQDSKNFIALRDVLRDMAQDSLSINGSQYSGFTSQIGGITDISGFITKLGSKNGNAGNTIGDISITIPIDHVEDYDDFVNKMRDDRKFEQFIQSITTDRLVGGSSLSKNKYKW